MELKKGVSMLRISIARCHALSPKHFHGGGQHAPKYFGGGGAKNHSRLNFQLFQKGVNICRIDSYFLSKIIAFSF